MFCFAFVQIQTFFHARHSESDYDILASIRNNFSVINRNIAKCFIRKDHSRHHDKWCVNFFLFSIYADCFLLFICIIHLNLQMSAFSFQICRFDFFSVQIVSKLYGNRKILICCSLIINIFTVCIPCQCISGCFECFITFYILNIFQSTCICQTS